MITALLLTFVIELPVYVCLFRKWDRYFLLDVILINIMTNVPLNMLLILWPDLFGMILLLELLVVIVEALLFKMKYDRSFGVLLLYSLIANTVSYTIGILIGHIL